MEKLPTVDVMTFTPLMLRMLTGLFNCLQWLNDRNCDTVDVQSFEQSHLWRCCCCCCVVVLCLQWSLHIYCNVLNQHVSVCAVLVLSHIWRLLCLIYSHSLSFKDEEEESKQQNGQTEGQEETQHTTEESSPPTPEQVRCLVSCLAADAGHACTGFKTSKFSHVTSKMINLPHSQPVRCKICSHRRAWTHNGKQPHSAMESFHTPSIKAQIQTWETGEKNSLQKKLCPLLPLH